jgi:glycoside/pentoside/hexuronide:cation symporter, GPH family
MASSEVDPSSSAEHTTGSSAPATIGRTRLALYGLMNLPTSIIGLPIALYIPAFYSQNLGLSLAVVGALIALSRITDVFTDPPIGVASDRWQTRFGRRKPWMVVGTPLMMISLWMLFVPNSTFAVALWSAVGGEDVSNLYLFVWISLLYLSFTLVDLPYRAWGAELSPHYDERSRVTGWREAFGYGGTLMALFIPLMLAAAFEMPGPANALLGIAVAVSGAHSAAVPARPHLGAGAAAPSESTEARVTWKRGLKIVWANGPYRRLVISLVFFVAGRQHDRVAVVLLRGQRHGGDVRALRPVHPGLLPLEQRGDSALVPRSPAGSASTRRSCSACSGCRCGAPSYPCSAPATTGCSS